MSIGSITETLDVLGIAWTCNGYNIWTAAGDLSGARDQLEYMGFRYSGKRGAWYRAVRNG